MKMHYLLNNKLRFVSNEINKQFSGVVAAGQPGTAHCTSRQNMLQGKRLATG